MILNNCYEIYLSRQFEEYRKQLDLLQSQLEVKDRLTEQLQSELVAERQHSREEVEKTTTALTAAQALHAADKQQGTIHPPLKEAGGFLLI